MKVDRNALLNHLRALHCNGLIPQASFSGAFACKAAAPENAAVVVTDGIPDTDGELGEAFGIQDLARMIWALGLGTADEIEVSMARGRLLLGLGETHAALLTSDPELTTTYIEDDMVDTVIEHAGADGDGFEVAGHALSDVRAAAGELTGVKKHQTPEATMVLGPERSGFRFGSSTHDQVVIPLPGVTTEYEETRKVHASPLRAVFAQAADGGIRLWPGKKESFLTLAVAQFRYYITPVGGSE